MICGFGFSFIATHLIPYAMDHQMKPGVASNVLALIGGISVFGTLGVGYVSQLTSRYKITLLLFIVRALAMGLLLFSASTNMIYVFAVLIGLTWTATVPLISDLSAETFGIQNTGSVLGALFLLHQVGAALGSYLGGLTADYTHGYHIMFIVTALLDVGAALLIFSYRKRQLIGTRKERPNPLHFFENG